LVVQGGHQSGARSRASSCPRARKCAYHNVEVVRKPRGLIHCPHEHSLHADVNSGLNIMLRGLKALGIKAELPRRIKVLSFLATPGGVKPINP